MMMQHLLAEVLRPLSAWAPIVLMIVIGVGFSVGTLVMSRLIGPSRKGEAKSTIYESGMVPVQDTRRRFNARFYIVAMIFLVFDVEIVFFYPWATLFPGVIDRGMKGLLLLEMAVFVVILLVAYLYAWGKGVFRWD
jgi:NADH-quinone oxidoreductase subunit A